MNRILLNSSQKIKRLLFAITMIFSFQTYALEDSNCGDISGFQFSNGTDTVTINNDDVYYIGDLPSNFYLDLLVDGFSESASFEVENKTTNQTYNISENYLPYTFPAGNGAWNFGAGEYEVKAEIFKLNNGVGSDCDSKTIKFEISTTPPCGSVTGYVFTDGTTSVPILHDQSYDINALPSNFYFKAVVGGFSESATIAIKNRYANSEFVIEQNTLPYTYPSTQQTWDLGPAEFEIKTRVYQADNAQGEKCDELNLKFTLYDSLIPDCGCHEGIFSLTFTYPGNEVLTVNNGEITNNGDGSYTLTKGGLAISDPEISINGTQIAKIHTSCSKNLLGVIFPEGIVVVAYLDGQGTYSNINTGCSTVSECGQITGFEFSNFSSDPTVAIVDGGSYDFKTIPTDFNINVLTSGNIESAFNTLTNTDTGEVYTKLENVIPYTFPGATNQVWTLGCGTFEFCASVYQEDNNNGLECDTQCITFTITNCDVDNCGNLDQFAFSNGVDADLTITDGGTFNLANLPTDFYIDAIVAGDSESVRLTVTNTDTNASTVIVENYIPYTYPAGGAAWDLGLGNFEVQAEIFEGNYCNSTLCDVQTISFTLVDNPPSDDCECYGGMVELTMSYEGTLDNADITVYNNFGDVLYNGIHNPGDLFSFIGLGNLNKMTPNVEFFINGTFSGAVHTSCSQPIGVGQVVGDFIIDAGLSKNNGPLCDDDDDDACTANAGSTNVDNTVFIFNVDQDFPVVTIIPGADTVLPTGATYSYACLISKVSNNSIRYWSNGLSIALEQPGDFKVHLLVYDTATLDLTTIVLGQTLISDLLNTISDDAICASLDGDGISITVLNGGADERTTDSGPGVKGKDNVVVEAKEDVLGADVKLYPNPVANQLNVEINLNQNEVMQYSMVDLNGKLVLNGTFNSNFSQIETKGLAEGLYILKLKSDSRTFTKKILVKR